MFNFRYDEEVAILFYLQKILDHETCEIYFNDKKINADVRNAYNAQYENILSYKKLDISDILWWNLLSKKITLCNSSVPNLLSILHNAFYKPLRELYIKEKILITNSVKELENLSFDENFIYKISNFLECQLSLKETYTVYIVPCSTITIASTHHNYNIIVTQHIECVKTKWQIHTAILHEYIHILEYSSLADKLLREGFSDFGNKIENINTKKFTLPYVLREILVHSLVSAFSPSYYGDLYPNRRILLIKENETLEERHMSDSPLCSYSDWYEHIRVLSTKLLPTVRSYMQSGRIIDSDFIKRMRFIILQYIRG